MTVSVPMVGVLGWTRTVRTQLKYTGRDSESHALASKSESCGHLVAAPAVSQ